MGTPKANKNYKLKHPQRVKKINSNYYQNNKEKFKECVEVARLKRLYNLTPIQLEQMRITQDSLCAICGENFEGKYRMHIDHDHSTGKLRSLLCRDCNTALGMFKENIFIVEKAFNYLKKWKQ